MPLTNIVIDLYHGHTVEPASGFHDISTAGIRALIQKATDGLIHIDTEHLSRRNRARKTPLLWGPYRCGVGGSPAKQADHYLRMLDPTDGELLCLDYEPHTRVPSVTLSEAERFVQAVSTTTLSS